jgi:hypothetical protein
MDLLPFRINCSQGVLESQESSLVPDGFLTECLNWVPEPTGGLRVRGMMKASSTLGVPTTRKNVGIGMFTRFTDPSIVQRSSTYDTGNLQSGSGTITPTLTWATPTQTGNILVAFIAIASSSTSGAQTFTATGWTARNAVGGSVSGTVPTCGIYELVTTQSYVGDTQPFTLVFTGASHRVTMFIVELTAVTSFDKVVATSGSNTGASVSPLSTTATTVATTQASEIVLGFSSAKRDISAGGSSAFALATSSTGWSENVETTGGSITGSVVNHAHTALYHKTVRATGTQALQVDMTWAADTANDNNYQTVGVITYKGWNDEASPGNKRDVYLAANDDGTNIDIYSITRSALVGGTYALIDPNVATNTGVPVAFTLGLGATWYTGSTFTGIRRYNGTASTVAGSPVGAKCIAINHERLWAAAGSRLSFSQVGDGSTWSGKGTGYFDFGRDDGEDIEDITPFAGGMVVGKATTLYFLAGSNTNEFQPVPLNAGGAAPGRSVLATPYGCVIAGREQIWLYDGQSVTPIGRAIQSSYGVADGAFVSLSYQDGSIYIADGTSTYIYVFDINAGVWHLEKIGTLAGDAAAVLYNYGDIQLYGPVSSTTASLLGFRTFPDPDRGRDEGLPEIFRASTGDRWFAGPRQTITPRYLWLQTRQRDGDATETALSIDVTYDTAETETIQPVDARIEGVYRDQRAISGAAKGTSSMKLTFIHIADEDEDVTYDVEAIAVDVERANAR